MVYGFCNGWRQESEVDSCAYIVSKLITPTQRKFSLKKLHCNSNQKFPDDVTVFIKGYSRSETVLTGALVINSCKNARISFVISVSSFGTTSITTELIFMRFDILEFY